MTYVRRYGDTVSAWQEVEVEVDLDDVLAELEDEEVAELYNDRFKGGALNERTVWGILYEKRVHMKDDDFLSYVSKLIEDKTGRILC
jgi:hypothetical protein